jgi:hypothetical protein
LIWTERTKEREREREKQRNREREEKIEREGERKRNKILTLLLSKCVFRPIAVVHLVPKHGEKTASIYTFERHYFVTQV